ncbi:MAG: HlyC/CorC family transporter [Bacteroidia bacterium]
MESELGIVLVSLLFSAFFSGSEIAFVSTNRLRIEIKGNKEGFISGLLSTYVKRPSHFITTMLIGNNIAMVIYGIFFSSFIMGIWESNNLYGADNPLIIFLLQTVLASIVVLIIAEFIPKALCSLSPFKVLTAFALPLAIFFFPFKYLVEITVWLAKLILKYLFRVQIEEDEESYDRIDLFHMVDESSTEDDELEGDVNTQIFKNALEFANTKIRDCMVPRPEIDAVDISADIEALKTLFFETGRSKLVVYRENIDNILGYVHSIDLFNDPESIQNMIIPMPFASESTPASELLRELIDKQRSVSQVVDEFGGTAGIVTIEDLIEEIFGEIDDEYDVDDFTEKQISENEFIFSARLEIEHINDKYELGIPEGDYDTLGGFLIHNYQSIPEEGEEISVDRFTFKILGMDGARINDLRLLVNSDEEYG